MSANMTVEFMELRTSANMIMIQYDSKFTELLRFVPDLVASEKIMIRRFEEGLAFYIKN